MDETTPTTKVRVATLNLWGWRGAWVFSMQQKPPILNCPFGGVPNATNVISWLRLRGEVSKMAWLCGKCRYRGPLSGDRPTYRCTRCGANAEWWRHYPLPSDSSTTYPLGGWKG